MTPALRLSVSVVHEEWVSREELEAGNPAHFAEAESERTRQTEVASISLTRGPAGLGLAHFSAREPQRWRPAADQTLTSMLPAEAGVRLSRHAPHGWFILRRVFAFVFVRCPRHG